MRLHLLVLPIALLACGGETAASAHADGSSAERPAPGTSACEPASAGTCTLCRDDLWHCGASPQGIPSCPPSGDAARDCPVDAGACTTCGANGSTAHAVMCGGLLNPGGDNDVETEVPVTCSP